jgi:hypothetical protein
MGPSGKRIRCDVVETNGAVLIEMIRLIPKERRVCIEESGQSDWLREILRPHVNEVVVEGTKEKKDRSQQKNDEKDARSTRKASGSYNWQGYPREGG